MPSARSSEWCWCQSRSWVTPMITPRNAGTSRSPPFAPTEPISTDAIPTRCATPPRRSMTSSGATSPSTDCCSIRSPTHPNTPHGELLDYVEGQRDLERGIVRTIGEPEQRFAEDKLRMLRAVRFAARFGYAIEAPPRKPSAASPRRSTRSRASESATSSPRC